MQFSRTEIITHFFSQAGDSVYFKQRRTNMILPQVDCLRARLLNSSLLLLVLHSTSRSPLLLLSLFPYTSKLIACLLIACNPDLVGILGIGAAHNPNHSAAPPRRVPRAGSSPLQERFPNRKFAHLHGALYWAGLLSFAASPRNALANSLKLSNFSPTFLTKSQGAVAHIARLPNGMLQVHF